MKKALIIQNKFVGDVLVASLLAKNLKRIFPNIIVHFFCYDKAIGILENNPYIDKILSFDNNKIKKISNLWQISSQIKQENYNLILDPYAKLQSRFITLRSNAEKKISFDKPFFKYIYTDVVIEFQNPTYSFCTSIEDRIKLLSPFQPDFKALDYQTEIFLTQEEIFSTKKMMVENGVDFSKQILIIGVLGSEPNKTYPLAYMAEIINYITTVFEGNILFNYVPNQQNEVDILLDLVEKKERIITTILGKNIREFAAILYHSDGIIANEGGAINIAKAMQKPTFSIFSPHKFRKNWGCYENFDQHSSFHLEDIYPEIYNVDTIKKILNQPKPYYKLLTPYFVLPKVELFLEKNKFKILKKIVGEYKKNKISSILISYNEEKNIREFIENMSFADEIIIVDSFSTDKTCDVIKEYPQVKFFQKEFIDFPSQKNYAIDLATNEWILFFDADERLNTKLKVEILKTINSSSAQDAYFIHRKFYFENSPMNFSGWQNDKAIRLFKKEHAKYSEKRKVHEIMKIEGSVGFLQTKLDHYSFESLESYTKKLDLYAKLKAEELYKKGYSSNFVNLKIKPYFRFFHHYILRLGILDGKNGYTIAKIYGDYVRKRYVYLDEMRKK